MDDYALVLNAGSSSLKFCVFQRPGGDKWRLEARGQIEGVGTAPRLSVKDEHGEKLADEALNPSVRNGSAAIDVLAGWLKSKAKENFWISRWANVLTILIGVQLAFGALTLLTLAPIVMQIIHLFLADAVWIVFVLLAASFLAEQTEAPEVLMTMKSHESAARKKPNDFRILISRKTDSGFSKTSVSYFLMLDSILPKNSLILPFSIQRTTTTRSLSGSQ